MSNKSKIISSCHRQDGLENVKFQASDRFCTGAELEVHAFDCNYCQVWSSLGVKIPQNRSTDVVGVPKEAVMLSITDDNTTEDLFLQPKVFWGTVIIIAECLGESTDVVDALAYYSGGVPHHESDEVKKAYKLYGGSFTKVDTAYLLNAINQVFGMKFECDFSKTNTFHKFVELVEQEIVKNLEKKKK